VRCQPHLDVDSRRSLVWGAHSAIPAKQLPYSKGSRPRIFGVYICGFPPYAPNGTARRIEPVVVALSMPPKAGGAASVTLAYR
jgi:hypothetical protein